MAGESSIRTPSQPILGSIATTCAVPGGVYRREGYEYSAAQWLVQRPRGLLLGRRPPSRRAGHRVRRHTPVGPGLRAFRTVEEATEAICAIEADYDRASAHAAEVAQEYFAAEKVCKSCCKTQAYRVPSRKPARSGRLSPPNLCGRGRKKFTCASTSLRVACPELAEGLSTNGASLPLIFPPFRPEHNRRRR